MAVMIIEPENFESEVLNYKGIVIVNFFANWCGPCKMTDSILKDASQKFEEEYVDFVKSTECDESVEYINYVKSVKFVKFDVDDDIERSNDFGIASIPTVIMFKDGEEVHRMVGLFNCADIMFLLNIILG